MEQQSVSQVHNQSGHQQENGIIQSGALESQELAESFEMSALAGLLEAVSSGSGAERHIGLEGNITDLPREVLELLSGHIGNTEFYSLLRSFTESENGAAGIGGGNGRGTDSAGGGIGAGMNGDSLSRFAFTNLTRTKGQKANPIHTAAPRLNGHLL